MLTTLKFKSPRKHHRDFDEWALKHLSIDDKDTAAIVFGEVAGPSRLAMIHKIAHRAWTARGKMRKDEAT